MSAAMPHPYVDAFFRFFADGKLDESKALPTVPEIIGRPPRSFESSAISHADAFRAAQSSLPLRNGRSATM
jgi:hypothetical protein